MPPYSLEKQVLNMKVVAFVGPSGTGKSFRAIGVAHDHHCDGIIDE